MGLWAKSVVIFNVIREYGKQSIRSLADRTGLSKSSVHRHLQAMDRRDRYPESSLWETEAGRTWLIRLMVATLFVFGLKRGVGAETLSEFLGRLHLDAHVGCSPSALRTVMHMLERLLLEGVIAPFPRWRLLILSAYSDLQGAPFGGMLEVSSNQYSSHAGAPLWSILRRRRSC